MVLLGEVGMLAPVLHSNKKDMQKQLENGVACGLLAGRLVVNVVVAELVSFIVRPRLILKDLFAT